MYVKMNINISCPNRSSELHSSCVLPSFFEMVIINTISDCIHFPSKINYINKYLRDRFYL